MSDPALSTRETTWPYWKPGTIARDDIRLYLSRELVLLETMHGKLVAQNNPAQIQCLVDARTVKQMTKEYE